ncbi:MAG: hypothetical protein AAF675_08870 [Pseudomonadota bacterium]
MSWYARKDRWDQKLGEQLLFGVMRSFEITTRWIDLWRLCRLLAPLGGWVIATLPMTARRLKRNLALIHPEMPDDERSHLMRAIGRHVTQLAIEYTHFRRFLPAVRLAVDGIEAMVARAEAGQGQVIVSAHYANWEAIRVALKERGVACGIIYRPFNNRPLDRYTLELIRAAGEPVMQKGPKGMRALHKHVASGGAALVLVDQRNTGASMIDFLGHRAETVTVAAALARRTGAALVPAVARRIDGRGGFSVRFETAVPDGEPEAMMAEVNRRIGAWIAEDPAQWFWLHNRWKRANDRRRASAKNRS